MTKWLSIFLRAIVSMRTRRNLAFENLLLRQQLTVLKNKGVRPQLTQADRFFWVFSSRIWSQWRDVLHIVRPETVVRWHRDGFRRYWALKSRERGRPPISPNIRGLIRRMCDANPYVERVIGSIRRECLNHTIIVSERHLRRVVADYVRYYNRARTHLSLAKDSPDPRHIHALRRGRIVRRRHCGGLHHEYRRKAA